MLKALGEHVLGVPLQDRLLGVVDIDGVEPSLEAALGCAGHTGEQVDPVGVLGVGHHPSFVDSLRQLDDAVGSGDVDFAFAPAPFKDDIHLTVASVAEPGRRSVHGSFSEDSADGEEATWTRWLKGVVEDLRSLPGELEVHGDVPLGVEDVVAGLLVAVQNPAVEASVLWVVPGHGEEGLRKAPELERPPG